MKCKVTAEISDVLPVPIIDTSIIDFGENSNVFGRVCDARNFFCNRYNVSSSQIRFISCKFI